MSAGSRSGVHCRRRNSRPSAAARLRAARVLPSPGTSSNSTCPPASSAASAIRSGRSISTTTVPTRSSTRRHSRDTSATESGSTASGSTTDSIVSVI